MAASVNVRLAEIDSLLAAVEARVSELRSLDGARMKRKGGRHER